MVRVVHLCYKLCVWWDEHRFQFHMEGFVCLFVSSLLLGMLCNYSQRETNHAEGQAGLSYATCLFSATCEAFTLETSLFCRLETTDDPNGCCGLYVGQACTCSSPEVPQSMHPDITTVCPQAPGLVITRCLQIPRLEQSLTIDPLLKRCLAIPLQTMGSNSADVFSWASPPHTHQIPGLPLRL